jgi:hypothetical protein
MSALYRAPAGVVLLGVVLLVLAALELGHQFGRRVPVGEAQFSRVAGPILALVGLVLAFSHSMATDRMTARRVAAVQEVNAIGTFWLRTELLPAPTRDAMRSRLRHYVDLHFEHRSAGIDQARLTVLEGEIERVQQEFWELLMAEARRGAEAHVLLLVTPALNSMIDDGAVALAAKENRLPDAVLGFLFGLVAIAAFTAGYGPHSGRRNWVLWGALTLVLGGVLGMLLDIDRPRRGLIVTDESVYERLRAGIRGD